MKTCFKCGTEKPLKEFYRHPQMADGHLNKCKVCTRADVSRYWADNADVLRQSDLMRRKLQRQVRNAPKNAVRDGRMQQPSECHYCRQVDALEAHHWNYYRPLDVTWLCKRCHRIADMARRDAEIKAAVVYREEAS